MRSRTVFGRIQRHACTSQLHGARLAADQLRARSVLLLHHIITAGNMVRPRGGAHWRRAAALQIQRIVPTHQRVPTAPPPVRWRRPAGRAIRPRGRRFPYLLHVIHVIKFSYFRSLAIAAAPPRARARGAHREYRYMLCTVTYTLITYRYIGTVCVQL